MGGGGKKNTHHPTLSQPPENLTASVAALKAELNATKTALATEVALKLGGGATVDATLPRFTGDVTCYVDDATGDVVGLQLGSSAPLCSTDGTPRSFAVPADGYIADVKVLVDKATGLVGQLAFIVKSNASLVPTNVVTCGTVAGGLPVPLMPKLAALASLNAACAPPRAAGRRLAQATSFIDPATVRVTVTMLSAPTGGGVTPPPPPPPPLVTCVATQVCSAGVCGLSCVGGSTKCSGLCINTANDPANCGSCGNACLNGQVCSAGVCGLSCVGGSTKCSGACVDTKIDPANCGNCGAACSFSNAGAFCSSSACGLGACNGSFSNCNKIAADGCEIDLSTDLNNCGGCGKVCGTKCVGGVCRFAFKPAQVIDGQLVTCSSVNNANPLYTECDDLNNKAGLYFPNGITCSPQWSTTNSVYSDTVGFCQSLTGTAKMEAYYTCSVSTTRATWSNKVWGTTSDNGYTQDVRCYY